MKNAFILLVLSLAIGASAATFTLTPNVVSNDYTGLITFQMTGLTAGETVLVQQFYDANSNGVADAGEICARSELVTDGEARLFNGVTNINLFRDEDGAANGTITASLRFAAAPDIARGIANYTFHFSSPSNHFTATNIAFAVRSVPYNQSVQGAVICGSTNVPNAYVALIQNPGGNIQIVVAGTTADANGNYSLKALPGIYEVVAVQAGYVGNLTNFPVVELLTNTTITTNLNLIAADTTIAGSLVDSTNALLKVIPNAQLIAYSTNLWFTISETDSNADFSIPVTSGNVWTVRATAQSAATEGYLVPDAAIESHYETFSGPVNNAFVMLKHATALVNGRVLDKLGNPVFGISLSANADFGQYNAFALSDSNGLYSMAIDAGVGTVNVENPDNPPASNFIWPTPQFGINEGQLVNLNVTGLAATAHYRVNLVNETGTPLSGVQAVADSYEYYGAYSFETSDANGYLDMLVFGGKWDFAIFTILPGLIFPDTPPFTITDGVNLTNNIIARTVTGTISGYVHDTGGHGIANLTVTVTNHVSVTNFTLQTTTDNSGNYSVAVFNGTWNVSPDNNALEGQGYVTPVAATNVIVPPAGAVANFIVSSVPPPQILTTSLSDATISNYYGAALEVTNGSYPTLWSLTSGALPGGLSLNIFGYIFGTPTNLGPFNFTLKVQDSRGSNDVKNLSIQVNPAPTLPLQILTTYLANLVVGCSYANQLQATNGTPPYSWALAGGSDPLPPGLQLATNGIISGTPTTDGYYMVNVQVTGADSATTNGTVQIYINPALQIYPHDLAAGSVGAFYFDYLYASGGAQPQTWSVISGSLPPGLMLDTNTGYITGMPTAPATNIFTVRVTDGCATIDTATSITNYSATQILTTYLSDLAVGCSYASQFQATNGTPPYTWALADGSDPLPPGLQFETNGILSGTPTNEGYYTIQVQVTGADSATTNGTVQIQVNPALYISYPHPLSAGEVGVGYYDTLYVAGGTQPQAWSVISGLLPPGLMLNTNTGAITGTPSVPGTNSFTLRVTDGCAIIDNPVSITNYPALQITTTTLPAASLNVPYNGQLQAEGGVPPYYWYNFTALPDGLTLNYDGSITGTPNNESPNEFTCVVYDAIGASVTTNLTMGAISQPVLDLPSMSGANQFTFRVTGVSGQGYTLQSATDLTNWADLFTTNAPADVFFLTDTNAYGPDRYYRLKVGP